MYEQDSDNHLTSLLNNPKEDLDCEIKGWLDLSNSKDHSALLAKSIIAIANHGGGKILIGFSENKKGIMEVSEQSSNLDQYSQDLINGIVERYCDPPFHCKVTMASTIESKTVPVIEVPGQHRIPIQAKRNSPDATTLKTNTIYVRKPGPKSEMINKSKEWDDLLERCFINRRNELTDLLRSIVSGIVPQANRDHEHNTIDVWIEESFERWKSHVNLRNADDLSRFPYGHYSFAYEIVGENQITTLPNLRSILRNFADNFPGYPHFACPTHEKFLPYPFEDTVECWFGSDLEVNKQIFRLERFDFWRVHREGRAFLIRNYFEDALENFWPGKTTPGTLFDSSGQIYAVAEAFLHARNLSYKLFNQPTSINFIARYEGLKDRYLSDISRIRFIRHRDISHQNHIILKTSVPTSSIDTNLPEIVHPFLKPLFNIFDFTELPMGIVADTIKNSDLSRHIGR